VNRPGTQLAGVRLNVRVGSADERPGERGLAHVVEHLVVRCPMAGGRVGHGALVDARTGREHTGYSVLVRRVDVAQAVDTLAAAFDELRVSSAVLAAELAAIRRETVQRGADVRRRLQEALLSALWSGTSYAHSPLGDQEVLDALTPEQVRVFHADRYRPAHATAVVVADRAADLLTDTADRWPHGFLEQDVPPPSVRQYATPAVEGVCLELPASAGPVGRAVGLAFTVTGTAYTEAGASAEDPRTCEELARWAVRAVGGLDVRSLELRGWTCVWVMVSAPDTDTALHVVRGALRDARIRLLDADGDSWLRVEALIPELRARDDLEMAAARAAGGGTRPSVPVTAGEVAALIELWERSVGRITRVGHTS
jgi:hypothetical protein